MTTASEYDSVFAVTISYSIVMKLMPREAFVEAGFRAQMLLFPKDPGKPSSGGTGTPVSLKSVGRGGNLVMSRSETKPSFAIRRSVSL